MTDTTQKIEKPKEPAGLAPPKAATVAEAPAPAVEESRWYRVHFLRNRVAHHEPVHHRDLRRDLDSIAELADWISTDARDWIVGASRGADVISRRP